MQEHRWPRHLTISFFVSSLGVGGSRWPCLDQGIRFSLFAVPVSLRITSLGFTVHYWFCTSISHLMSVTQFLFLFHWKQLHLSQNVSRFFRPFASDTLSLGFLKSFHIYSCYRRFAFKSSLPPNLYQPRIPNALLLLRTWAYAPVSRLLSSHPCSVQIQ